MLESHGSTRQKPCSGPPSANQSRPVVYLDDDGPSNDVQQRRRDNPSRQGVETHAKLSVLRLFVIRHNLESAADTIAVHDRKLAMQTSVQIRKLRRLGR